MRMGQVHLRRERAKQQWILLSAAVRRASERKRREAHTEARVPREQGHPQRGSTGGKAGIK